MKQAFPNHFINPQEKGEDWLRQMIKAIWDEFDNQSIKSFNKGADRYMKNRLYALGKQSNDIYKPMFEVSDDDNSSFINLDLSPPAIIPKFMRIINNKHSKIDFTINAQAIDPFALQDKLEYEATEQANIKLRKILDEVGIPSDILKTGEIDQPMEEEELTIKMEFGYKHNMAIDIEKRIDAVFSEGRIKECLSVQRARLFDSGVAIFKAFTDNKTGKVGFRTVEPSNWVVSPTADPFFRDIWYAGESVLMSIDEIRRECKESGVDVTEEQLENLAARYRGKHGNANIQSTAMGSFYYDSTKVPVIDCEFKSLNRCWFEKRWDKRGNPVVGKVDGPSKKEGREYYKDDDIVVYRGKWVVDTEILFNYGLKSDIYRKDNILWDTRLSYIAVAPELNMMETNPTVEAMIPVVDQIVLAWYKLQNVIAKARPRGILIEIGALEDISLGDGGDESGKMTPMSVLDMFTQTGVMVYRKIAADGSMTPQRPVEELNNGLGNEAAEYFAVIDRFMSYLGGMIGLNDVTDGSTPDPKLLNGVAGLAQEATSNALHHLIEAERYLVEVLADEVAVRVHDSMTFKKNSVYRNIVSASGIKSTKQDIGPLHRVYGLVVEYNADNTARQELQQNIMIALDRQQITIADSIAIKGIRNLKQAEMILAFRIKKNEERAAERAEREKITNAEASVMAAKGAEEEKRKTLSTELETKLALLEAETQAKMALLTHEYTLKGALAADLQDGKLESDAKKTEASKEIAAMKKGVAS